MPTPPQTNRKPASGSAAKRAVRAVDEQLGSGLELGDRAGEVAGRPDGQLERVRAAGARHQREGVLGQGEGALGVLDPHELAGLEAQPLVVDRRQHQRRRVAALRTHFGEPEGASGGSVGAAEPQPEQRQRADHHEQQHHPADRLDREVAADADQMRERGADGDPGQGEVQAAPPLVAQPHVRTPERRHGQAADGEHGDQPEARAPGGRERVEQQQLVGIGRDQQGDVGDDQDERGHAHLAVEAQQQVDPEGRGERANAAGGDDLEHEDRQPDEAAARRPRSPAATRRRA